MYLLYMYPVPLKTKIKLRRYRHSTYVVQYYICMYVLMYVCTTRATCKNLSGQNKSKLKTQRGVPQSLLLLPFCLLIFVLVLDTSFLRAHRCIRVCSTHLSLLDSEPSVKTKTLQKCRSLPIDSEPPPCLTIGTFMIEHKHGPASLVQPVFNPIAC